MLGVTCQGLGSSRRDLSGGCAWKEKQEQRGRLPVEERGRFSDTKIRKLNTNLQFFHALIPKRFYFLFLVKRDKNKGSVGGEGDGAGAGAEIPQGGRDPPQGHLGLLSPCPRLRWPLWPRFPDPQCPNVLGCSPVPDADVSWSLCSRPVPRCPQSLCVMEWLMKQGQGHAAWAAGAVPSWKQVALVCSCWDLGSC